MEQPKRIKEEKLVDESDISELDTKFISRETWMVKIPQFVSEYWASLPPNTELGKVIVRQKKGQTTMSVELNIQQTADFPQKYDLLYQTPPGKLLIFSENEANQNALEGTVVQKCDMKPLQDSEEYRRIMKLRMEKSNTKLRTVQTIDDDELNAPRMASGFMPKKRKFEEKRERMEKEELIDLIFTTFESATYYDLKTLVAITKQPTMYLKEVLSELCIYSKRGPHKGMYELKPQFKGRSTTTPAAPMQT